VPKHLVLQYSQRYGGFLERIANDCSVTHCHTFYLEMWNFFRTFIGWEGGKRLTRETQFDFLRDCIKDSESISYAVLYYTGNLLLYNLHYVK